MAAVGPRDGSVESGDREPKAEERGVLSQEPEEPGRRSAPGRAEQPSEGAGQGRTPIRRQKGEDRDEAGGPDPRRNERRPERAVRRRPLEEDRRVRDRRERGVVRRRGDEGGDGDLRGGEQPMETDRPIRGVDRPGRRRTPGRRHLDRVAVARIPRQLEGDRLPGPVRHEPRRRVDGAERPEPGAEAPRGGALGKEREVRLDRDAGVPDLHHEGIGRGRRSGPVPPIRQVGEVAAGTVAHVEGDMERSEGAVEPDRSLDVDGVDAGRDRGLGARLDIGDADQVARYLDRLQRGLPEAPERPSVAQVPSRGAERTREVVVVEDGGGVEGIDDADRGEVDGRRIGRPELEEEPRAAVRKGGPRVDVGPLGADHPGLPEDGDVRRELEAIVGVEEVDPDGSGRGRGEIDPVGRRIEDDRGGVGGRNGVEGPPVRRERFGAGGGPWVGEEGDDDRDRGEVAPEAGPPGTSRSGPPRGAGRPDGRPPRTFGRRHGPSSCVIVTKRSRTVAPFVPTQPSVCRKPGPSQGNVDVKLSESGTPAVPLASIDWFVRTVGAPGAGAKVNP